MRSQATADPAPTRAAPRDALTFRGPTVEEAVATAERALGCRVTVIQANKIRRGGIGGFFASDLGVDVVVVPQSETLEQALERLVGDTDAQDDVAIDVPMPDLSMAALRTMSDITTILPRTAARTQDATPATPAAPAESADHVVEQPAPMVRAEDIVAELRTLTSGPQMSFGRAQELADLLNARPTALGRAERTTTDAGPAEVPADVPADVPAPARKRLGFPAAARFAEAAAITAADPVHVAAAPMSAPVEARVEAPVVVAPSTPVRPIEVLEPVAADPIDTAPIDTAPIDTASIDTAPIDTAPTEVATAAATPVAATPVAADAVAATPVAAPASAAPAAADPVAAAAAGIAPDVAGSLVAAPAQPDTERTEVAPAAAGAPSRRHVELTLAAADQLIESVSRNGNAQRLTVRVVLRAGDQREVEAEAHWEAAPTAPASRIGSV